MPDRAPPSIARVRLSRSLVRLLALPVLLLVVAAAAAVWGVLLVPGLRGVLIAGAAGVLALVALVVAGILLSVRLDVEEAAVRVRWLGGKRVYTLSPGPITRVRLRGESASSLRSSRRLLGWQLGRAVLREEETIEVVRLAPTSTAILVPTDRGRLAIGAAREDELLDALARAARARQRQEELAASPPPADVTEASEAGSEDEEGPARMTGIERAVFERLMAQERVATGAEPALPDGAAAATGDTLEAGADSVQIAVPARTKRRLPTAWARRQMGPLGRPGPSVVVALLPLVGAGAAWGLGLMLDRIPAPGTDLGRLTGLALVLAGPATTVGAIMARVWWPRLMAVVVVGGLAGSVFVGRALVGG